jgi:hypothetical protein
MTSLNKVGLAMKGQGAHGSIVGLLLGLVLVAAGCATRTHTADAPAAAPVAAQPSAVAGTWRGSAYAVGVVSFYHVADFTVRFEDDGRWKAVETRTTGVREFSGTSTIRGDEVLLAESRGHHFLTLTRRGARLYGVHGSAPNYTHPGPMRLELTRAE